MKLFRAISCVILIMSFFQLKTAAQRRSCDTKPIVISPEAYDTLISPSEIDLVVGIINLGPDTLIPSDNFRINYRYGGVITNYEFYGFNRLVYPGDTFFHKAKFKVAFWVSVDSVDFCAEVKAWNNNSNGLIRETGTALSNNRGCTPTTHIDNNPIVSLNEIPYVARQTKVYPNPARDKVQVKSTTPIELVVTNTNGLVVFKSQNIKRECHIIDVSSWSRGLYFFTIREKENTYSQIIILN
jgi:hypothetical protein